MALLKYYLLTAESTNGSLCIYCILNTNLYSEICSKNYSI